MNIRFAFPRGFGSAVGAICIAYGQDWRDMCLDPLNRTHGVFVMYSRLFWLTLLIQLQFLLQPTAWAAENWTGAVSAQYPISFEMSPKEACENAEEQAKLDAMSLAGCEKLSFRQFETCESSEDNERCSFFQETFNAYDNCFIARYDLLDRNTRKLDLNQNQVCEVRAEVAVRGFRNKHDPGLVVQVDDTLSRVFKIGEEVSLSGRLSQPAFIHVLGWYPEMDRDNLYRLHADAKFTEDFILPPATQSERWWAVLPENWARDESNEFMIVLASKTPFQVMEKEARSDFFRRLDELGRENWRIARYGYRIVK
ncbi:MAG: hypothetical protein VXA66_11305 [Alphaproteobacteria bacterium]